LFMKKKFAPPQPLIYLLAIMLVLNYSCKKIPEQKEKSPVLKISSLTTRGGGGCVDVMESDADTSEVPTILGNQLQGNPYSVSVMQQASINLYGNSNGIAVNKLYVRFRPANSDQLLTLESLDLDLYDYPLDFEVLHQGDYYPQSGIGPDEIPWYYGVVDVGFLPPAGIQYEILQQVFIPDRDIWLEQEAFRITGNPFEDTCGIVPNLVAPPCDDPCNPGPGCPPPPPECGGGGGIPPDPRVPTGNLYVWDNRLGNGLGGQGTIVPVRRIRVVARNFLKTERVYTNDAGAFSFTKRFKKVQLIVKMKNNNTAVRGLFGVRLWNIVWPLKKNIGKYKGDLNNIQYTFFRQEAVRTRGMQDWVGVTAFNKRTDFGGLAGQDYLPGVPTTMSLFITPLTGSAATPMFPHRYPDNNELLSFFVRRYILGVALFPQYALFLNELAKSRIDLLYGYNRFLEDIDSDDISEVMFHELSHAQHYNKVGNDWWHEFVLSELTETADNEGTQFDPYGQGNTVRSPIIALGESWAYHYGRVLADRVYGINFSSDQVEQGQTYTNGFPVATLSSHLNLLEDFHPGRLNDPFRWIPQGVYYDMIDDRNDLTVPFPRVLINDEVLNYTNLQFFNALDADINSLQAYRVRLLQENGNNQGAEVTNLFAAYGY
jgi:hypothetical protein